MRSLNTKQRKIVLDLLHHVETSEEQICRFISGGAGVGKTHTTHMIYETLLRHYTKGLDTDPNDIFILKVAPTGKAAFLIKGNTIHSTFKVPCNQAMNYIPLSSSQLNTMRITFRSLKFLIVDEVSMVGRKMLNFMDRRLKDVRGTDKVFGGISVLFIGDLFQLKPVMDSYVFLHNNSSAYGPLEPNLWKENVDMIELNEIMR